MVRSVGQGLSDIGRRRKNNQDAFLVDDILGLYIVADGMGGHKAGEVASAIAANTIMDELREGLPNIKPGEIDEETGYSQETLIIKEAIKKAILKQ